MSLTCANLFRKDDDEIDTLRKRLARFLHYHTILCLWQEFSPRGIDVKKFFTDCGYKSQVLKFYAYYMTFPLGYEAVYSREYFNDKTFVPEYTDITTSGKKWVKENGIYERRSVPNRVENNYGDIVDTDWGVYAEYATKHMRYYYKYDYEQGENEDVVDIVYDRLRKYLLPNDKSVSGDKVVYLITFPDNFVKVGKHSGPIKALEGRYNTHTPAYGIEYFQCNDYTNVEKSIHSALKALGLWSHLEFFKDTVDTRRVWEQMKSMLSVSGFIKH